MQLLTDSEHSTTQHKGAWLVALIDTDGAWLHHDRHGAAEADWSSLDGRSHKLDDIIHK